MSKQQQIKRTILVLGLAIGAMTVSIVLALVLTHRKKSLATKNELPLSPKVTAAPSAPSEYGRTSAVPTYYEPSTGGTSFPSLRPSSSPSIRILSRVPSSSPSLSELPSSIPTRAPSGVPTSYSSDAPSDAPSDSPSLTPSILPSLQPTVSPYAFVLKMHWEADYFWQDTFQEFRWCVECIKCINLTDTDNGPTLCTDDDPYDPTCGENDQIWIQNCGGPKRGNAVFNVDTFPTYDVLRIKSSDLCLTRTADRYVRLERCIAGMYSQKWNKITLDAPFVLRGIGANDYRCLTQAHHPKAGEVLHMKNCTVAYIYNTSLWDAVAAE